MPRQDTRIRAKNDTRPVANVRNGNQIISSGSNGVSKYRRARRKCNNCGIEKVTSNNSCKQKVNDVIIYCGTMRVMDKRVVSKKLGKIF